MLAPVRLCTYQQQNNVGPLLAFLLGYYYCLHFGSIILLHINCEESENERVQYFCVTCMEKGKQLDYWLGLWRLILSQCRIISVNNSCSIVKVENHLFLDIQNDVKLSHIIENVMDWFIWITLSVNYYLI